MDFLEKDLEDLIYEASQTEEGRSKLVSRGLYPLRCPLKRQVPLGSYGIADLVEVRGTVLADKGDLAITVILMPKII